MSGAAFATRSPFLGALGSACLLAQVLLAAPLRAHSPQPALTPEQQEKIQQRNSLVAQVNQLQRQGKLAEAIVAARKVLSIDRQLCGDMHENVARSLERLAGLYELQEDFTAAKAARRDVLDLCGKLHGEKHWRTADARWALDRIERLGRMTAAQRRRLAQAQQLNGEVLILYRQGRYRKALEEAIQIQSIRKELLGEQHPDYAASLNNLAALYQAMGDYMKAEPLLRQALTIRKEALGEKHPAYAINLNNLALVYQNLGDYAKAEPLFRQDLQIRKELLGEQHPVYATSLNNLAALYSERGDYAKAEPLYRQALQIRKEVLGEKHPDYATSLNNLAALYVEMGNYAQAESLYRQAMQIREETLGRKHPDYATSLDQLALLYKHTGEYARAESLYRQALTIRKEALGEKHPDYATSLNNLALLYQAMGEYAQAEPLLHQAMRIRQKALGEQHRAYAESLNNLALLYKALGDYARAEPLYREAMQIHKAALGKKHAAYATDLNNLAGLYKAMGDYARAEPMYRQAMQIRQQVLGEKHPDYATSLNNLAALYVEMGNYAQAESLYRQAMQIREETLGRKHPDYATSLSNLAFVHGCLGNHAKAEPLYQAALKIKKETLGEKHPDYATDLNNLAYLYDCVGDYAKAESLYRAALKIKKETLGEKHPDYAASLGNLAALYTVTGDYTQAEHLLQQALEISRTNLELAAATQSQRQQLDMLTDLRWYLDAYLSLPPPAHQDPAAPYRFVLAWKGAVSRRQRLQRLARKRPELADDFAALDQVSSRLASLALATPDPAQLTNRRKLIERLTEEKDQLEAKLARHSATFGPAQRQQRLEPAQLQAVLPADTVLLDFLEYSQGTPAPGKKGGWQWQPQLVAFVVRHNSLQRVDLGPAPEINAAAERWRLALQRRFRTEGDAEVARAVHRLVWQPLQQHVQGARLVLVSPDGVLTRIPFAALPGSRPDGYLLEEAALGVVPVPQLLPQLLEQPSGASPSEPSLLLVGEVCYDSASAGPALAESRIAPRHGTDALFHWPALPNTRAEVSAIAGAFGHRWPQGKVTTLLQGQATEASVRQQAPASRYLHLATHGYFAPKELRSALAAVSREGRRRSGDLFALKGVAGFHPGLLSGLVLAGANRPVDAERDDGILTALEVEALDLSGVELATLSACETGLGESASGEGLLGLQRAFQTAGARCVVAGLWQVDDAATRKLMTLFYTNLWEKKLPRLEALRQAQLWMLREGESWMQTEGLSRGMVDVRVPKERLPIEDGRLAPYYWAAFSLSGDWR